MADKTITCKDCGADFLFTENEQAFYKEKGFENDPQRCPACRQAKKRGRNSGGYGKERVMYPAVCAECGADTTVPFEPTGEKPVYCRDCFQAHKSN